MSDIAGRLDAILEKVAGARRSADAGSASVELVAVSKTHAPEAVSEIVQAGHLLFGESRVQEARAKIPLCPARARWHFIGHLQSNKVRAALPLFEMFHAVDSLELARDIDRIAAELGLHPRILLEVNVAGESSKHGFSPGKLREQFEALLGLERLQIEGLMTIPPFAPEPEESRPYFAQLRTLREELSTTFSAGLPHLSMGMSGDFVVAIEEGATFVRVGSAIFGERSGKVWRPGASE